MMDYKKRTLRIQSILYNNSETSIQASLNSIGRAAELLKKANLIDFVEVIYGDCSQAKIFENDNLEYLINNSSSGIDKVICIFFNENLGTAKGHNLLMQNACTEYLVILNPDIIVAPNTLIELMRGFSSSLIGIVEARQLPIEHPKDYDSLTGETSWASTACILTKTEIAHQINGFDHESFFLYCDDVDFSWRVKLAGFKVIFKTSAIIFHDKRLEDDGSLSPTNAERYYSAEAALMLAHKYSRHDLVEKISNDFRNCGDNHCMQALKEYEARLASGRLVPSIDTNHKIAQFINGYYAHHRF
ncbi:hypothetical protein ACD661_11305 [Legionella lytica]|uniref:Glycosyltransferase family 2 protein n=1 Tax=Legionella lytica TaxID=96232 RepID=A0ABW8DAD3_9GAMM